VWNSTLYTGLRRIGVHGSYLDGAAYNFYAADPIVDILDDGRPLGHRSPLQTVESTYLV
jgi:hypothetical protein